CDRYPVVVLAFGKYVARYGRTCIKYSVDGASEDRASCASGLDAIQRAVLGLVLVGVELGTARRFSLGDGSSRCTMVDRIPVAPNPLSAGSRGCCVAVVASLGPGVWTNRRD